MKQPIISECGPSCVRICPACGRWFALTLVVEQAKITRQETQTYECRFCQTKTLYAVKRPPYAV